jgi:hypothetical protein
MPDATLTTQQPGQQPVVRPVPPSWATVAPLLQRWQIALVPHRDGTLDQVQGGLWDVLATCPGAVLPAQEAYRVPFARLPQAIADVAARCAAEIGTDGPR